MMTHPKKQHILDIYGHEPDNLDDLAKCVMSVIDLQRPIVGFSWSIQKNPSVSNSHHAPLDGTANWSGRDPGPRGYPGWSGRVWIRYKDSDNHGFGSSPFASTLTYPGTGGSGAYSGPWQSIANISWNERCVKMTNDRYTSYYDSLHLLSWDFRFFDSDWPDLYKHEIFNILADSPTRKSHTFLREDPATVQKDEEYMAWVKVASAISGDRPGPGLTGSGLTRIYKASQ